MIHILIYTHGNTVDNTFGFFKPDLKIVSIKNDFLIEEDFDKLWLAIKEIDTKDLVPEKWYKIGFVRFWDNTGLMLQNWYVLVENPVIFNI